MEWATKEVIDTHFNVWSCMVLFRDKEKINMRFKDSTVGYDFEVSFNTFENKYDNPNVNLKIFK